MSKHLVLSIRRLDFKNDKGDQVQLVKVTYLDQAEANENVRGAQPLTINGALELWNDIEQVPGQYELDFRQRPDSKGRPTLTLAGATFLGAAQAVG